MLQEPKIFKASDGGCLYVNAMGMLKLDFDLGTAQRRRVSLGSRLTV
jgi:hypothetical protein